VNPPHPENRQIPVGTAALILSLLLGIQPIATDLYLPALPMLTKALQASPAVAQYTLSAMILSFGTSQLVLGPLSDRHGRRPVLLWGLGLFLIAGIGAALSQHIAWLIGWRMLQGIGMAATVVCGRAIVRDLFEPQQGVRVMSMALSGLGAIALISPAVGGLLANLLGWRASLLSLSVFAAIAWTVVWRQLPEPLAQPHREPPSLRRWWHEARGVLKNPSFLSYAMLVVSTYNGVFLNLAGSSYVLIDHRGVSRLEFGLALGATSSFFLFGTWLCRRLLPGHGPAGAVRVGALFTLSGGVALPLLVWAFPHSALAFVLPVCIYCIGHGIHQSCGQAGAVAPFPRKAGLASALAGFLLSSTAFCSGTLLGHIADDSGQALAICIGIAAVLTAAIGLGPVQRHGRLDHGEHISRAALVEAESRV